MNDVDYSASETLVQLHELLNEHSIRLVFCDVEDHVRDELISDNLEKMVGNQYFFSSKEDVILAYETFKEENVSELIKR